MDSLRVGSNARIRVHKTTVGLSALVGSMDSFVPNDPGRIGFAVSATPTLSIVLNTKESVVPPETEGVVDG